MVVKLHNTIKGNTKPQEYKQYIDSLKNSILTAFYTPENVISSIAETLPDNGVMPTKYLDPSAGQGAFMRSFAKVAPTRAVALSQTICESLNSVICEVAIP